MRIGLKGVRTLLERAVCMADDWLFPERTACLCCDGALGEDEQDGLCPACAAALEEAFARQDAAQRAGGEVAAPGLAYVYAAYPYEGQAKRLIVRLKFGYVRAAAVPLARAMAMLPCGEEDVIVPVPTTRSRLRERGFNQAEVLSRHLGQTWGMRVLPALVRRDGHAAQSTLGARQRRENLRGCMCAVEDVLGRRVLLVDDVYTTGSTAMEAARALLEGGAASVGVLTAARAMAPQGAKGEALFVPSGKKRRLFDDIRGEL